MTNMDTLKALEDALGILSGASGATCYGPESIWRKVYHAKRHLEQQHGDVLEEVVGAPKAPRGRWATFCGNVRWDDFFGGVACASLIWILLFAIHVLTGGK